MVVVRELKPQNNFKRDNLQAKTCYFSLLTSLLCNNDYSMIRNATNENILAKILHILEKILERVHVQFRKEVTQLDPKCHHLTKISKLKLLANMKQ